ncbi:MAG TPA: 2-succinyl-5-enolpyruvyl-6-hydroxy-3-cyclohexene-1-carboxylic-acid synthase [Pseudonocardiaceae bacterium]|nr:2-succinyl-5-enolpyruvyl-6-hydroxy-3-cyclohexene-1-carboxylic-acid synthase [Pseudonocardiaceae bacterium]
MNPSTAQATVVADELVRAGLRHVVVCPGSRNAPLSMALHALAEAGRVALHVRIDERSAGFLALGLAKGLRGVDRSGDGLAGVLCTSGTAVANLHPAVLEAHHSGTPLLVLTADRPAELLGTGANQTIAQRGLFGAAAEYVEMPVAQRKPGGNAAWRGTVCRAAALTEAGGPVQLNLPFAEPLVPDGDPDWPHSLAGRPIGAWTARRPDRVSHSAGEPVTDLGPRTLIVVGADRPDRIAAAAELARVAGWPVIAEPTESATVLAADGPLIRHGSLLLNSGELAERLRPDAVVVVGRPTLSRGVGRLTRETPVVYAVGDVPQWTDPGHVATTAASWLSAGDVTVSTRDSNWLDAWRRADAAAGTALDKLLAEQSWPVGPQVVGELLDALPPEAVLFLGSSNPIRFVDLLGRTRPDVWVTANRGVAGIDGSVSTAAGLTLAMDRPGYALLGDLTFLHDVNGLLAGPAERRPDLTIVVLNDDGGGIFSLLEQGAPEHASSFERVFGTPHGADLAALCAGYHVPYTRCGTPEELRQAFAAQPTAPAQPKTRTQRRSGPRLIEVRTHRADLRDWDSAIRAAISTGTTDPG